MTRKERADSILYEMGLLKELERYGKPHPIGSYRMDMMAWNDLGIDVENDGMSLERLHELTAYVLKTFRPVWYEAKEEITDEGNTVWFHGFEAVIDGEMWNFDIWFFNRETIRRAEDYCDWVMRSAGSREKETIVKLKRELIERKLYGFNKYHSTQVYEAVIDRHIATLDEFLQSFRPAIE